jgi:hypothetical protein
MTSLPGYSMIAVFYTIIAMVSLLTRTTTSSKLCGSRRPQPNTANPHVHSLENDGAIELPTSRCVVLRNRTALRPLRPTT